uniref:Ras-GEF domain-containing protein n=1 Tax=Amphimedon queenslandica TaxID=400682 RepID=A0A1X7V1Z8_AMPQE
MFRKIESVELVDVGWTRKEKEEYSPNLIKMSTYETKLTNWLCHCVLFNKNIWERVEVISNMIDTMERRKQKEEPAFESEFNELPSLVIDTEEPVEKEQLGSGSGNEGSKTTTPSEPDTTFELDTPAISNLLDTT